jgi:hypothetical protein
MNRSRIEVCLNLINHKLDLLLVQQQKGLDKMAVDITALTAEVANNTTVDGSIEQLLTNLAAQLAALAAGTGDAATQTALNSLVTTLQQNDAAIAASVTANTPAAPTA